MTLHYLLDASIVSAPVSRIPDPGQIAAVAQVNSLVLVTANPKDFARFKDLRVENWMRKTQHR